MNLQVSHDKVEDIPEEYRELYSEREGKQVLTGIGGVKTQGDIDRLQTALQKERDDHKVTRDKGAVWGELDHTKVITQLDRMAELEIAASGNKAEMDAKLEELTEARIRTRLAPVEREASTLKQKLEVAETELVELRALGVRRTVHDAVRGASTKSKVVGEAIPDVLLLADAVFEVGDDGVVRTKDAYGTTPGLDPELWLQEMQDKRPHWWPRSTGGESRGSGGVGGFNNNPWTNEHWNMTEQGKVVTELGQERAEVMAKSAGSSVGGMRPEVKTK